MLTGVINTCDPDAAEALDSAGRGGRAVTFVYLQGRRLQNYELVRAVNGHEADIAFLDFADYETAVRQADVLRKGSPHVALAGFLSDQAGEFAENPAPEVVDAWLSMPPTPQGLERTLWTAMRRPQNQVRCPLLVFVPAKVGCGGTTISLHVADSLANGLGKRTLLLDADEHSGVLELMLNTRPKQSVTQLLEQCGNLTPAVWNMGVQTVGKLDVAMHYVDEPGRPAHWTAIHKLLRYASTYYDYIVADVPDATSDAARELLAQAGTILLVTTMELAPMKLAGRRLEEIRGSGAGTEKVRLVLNRWHRHNLSRADTEKLLSVPVAGVVPNDYKTFQAALQAAAFVSPETAPGRGIAELTRQLAGVAEPAAEGHRLLRFFVGK